MSKYARQIGFAILLLLGLCAMLLGMLNGEGHHNFKEIFWKWIENIGECLFLIGTLHFFYEMIVKKWDQNELFQRLADSLKVIRLENRFARKFMELHEYIDGKTLDRNLSQMLSHLSNIFIKDMNRFRIPLELRNMFEENIFEKISSFNEELKEIEHGNFRITHKDSVNATFCCMQNANEEVFAISFPDIDFWQGHNGKEYLEAHKYALKKPVKIKRFFIIPNDKKIDILTNPQTERKFIDNLKRQIDIGVEIYINHELELNLGDLKISSNRKNNFCIPDISLYDKRIASEWAEKINGTTSKTIISYSGPYLSDAISVHNFFVLPRPMTVLLESDSALENRLKELKRICA